MMGADRCPRCRSVTFAEQDGLDHSYRWCLCGWREALNYVHTIDEGSCRFTHRGYETTGNEEAKLPTSVHTHRMSKRTRRNTRIVVEFVRARDFAEVAERFRVSERVVRSVMRRAILEAGLV